MFRKAAVIITVIILTCLTALGCYGAIRGSGNIVTRSYEYADFSRVEISSAFDVEIVPGSAFSISVTADENIFDFIRVSQTDNILKIAMGPGYSYFPSVLIARVAMPDIESLSAFGASRVDLSGFTFEHEFAAELSGASTLELTGVVMGDISLDAGTASRIQGVVQAIDMTFEVTGASRVNLTGNARNVRITGGGASNIDVSGLEAQNATVGLSGASSAVINITGRLDAGLTGASHLKYIGEPELGNINLSDFSTVSQH